MNKYSMHDIANLSGFSIATVSRVINGNGGYSEETEIHIKNIIKKTGFVPNSNAKSLRTRLSQTIGVIVPDLTNEFFSKLVREIELFFLPLNYSVFVCDTNEDKEIEDQYLNNLISKKVDGIIYISGHHDVSMVETMYSIPLVYIDRSPKNAKVLVHSDNENGGYIAGMSLINAGCKHLVMVRDYRMLSPVEERSRGFLRALEEKGFTDNRNIFFSSEVTYDGASNVIKEVLLKNTTIDGIFASNDTIALGALHTIENIGKKVPKDIKIIGFDGVSATEYSRPTISTVKQDFVKMAKIASEQLLKIINGVKLDPQKFVVPVELIERDTTKK